MSQVSSPGHGIELDEVRNRVRALFTRLRLRGLTRLVVPITAHIAGLVTIFVAYFARTGRFEFQLKSWLDWTVVAIVSFITLSGTFLIFQGLSTPRRFIVGRSELYDLLTVARADAELSVVSLAGDLSWLEDDLKILQSLRKENPSLSVTIIYEQARVSPSVEPTIHLLQGLGIRLIPYPAGVSSALRFLVVDAEIRQNARACIYTRLPVENLARKKQRFEWCEIRPDDPAVLSCFLALSQALQSVSVQTIRVGVTGVNNVGKTTLVRILRERLQQWHQVMVYPDEFKVRRAGTSMAQNYFVLISQALVGNDGKSDVAIYDRTLVDSLAFLRIRGNDTAYRALGPTVAAAMGRFTLILDIRHIGDSYSTATTRVSAADRARLRTILDEFFELHDVQRLKIWLDPKNFQESLASAADQAVHEIEKRLKSRIG